MHICAYLFMYIYILNMYSYNIYAYAFYTYVIILLLTTIRSCHRMNLTFADKYVHVCSHAPIFTHVRACAHAHIHTHIHIYTPDITLTNF